MAARPRARTTPTDRATPTATPTHLLGPLLLLLLAMLAAGSEACTVDECSQKFGEALSAAPVGGPAHAQSQAQARVCAVLQRYRECVHGRAAACHGNLGYHSALTIVRRRMQAHSCGAAAGSGHHAATRRPPPPPTPPPPGRFDDDTEEDTDEDTVPVGPPEVLAPPPVDSECDYRGPADHVHCGLFGDPHLKTFSGQYQTCRVEGAWPLIDNAHLAVQVTNKPVLNGSRATATTKVTVIVRGAGSAACSRHRKTYEATADAPLPATFVDGTQRSAGGNVQLSVHEEGRRVEIAVRHVDALVVVRRAGRYLAFSARLPRHLAVGPSAGRPSSGLQLCARGCPSSELLHPLEDRGSAMKQEDAEAVCGASNLTGSYHDWCVFDVMTTGADDFADAAHAALTDVRRLDPLSAPSTSSSSSSASGGAPRGGREQRSGSGAASSLAGWVRAALAAAAVLVLAV